jgi:hypothetical protein
MSDFCKLETSRLKSKLYFVTVSNVDLSDVTKNEVFDYLVDECEQLMVASDENGTEHRIYVRRRLTIEVQSFCKIIKNLYTHVSADDILVITPNNSGIIKRCCGQDTSPCSKGISYSSHSFRYQMHKWVIENENFDPNHPFLVARKHNMEETREYHRKYHSRLPVLVLHKKINQVKKLNAWQDEVVDWYNDYIDEENRDEKKPLFLYGKSDTGKSYFIRYFLFKKFEDQIFMPIRHSPKFGFSEYDASKQNILIADEFRMENFDSETWKKVAGGQTISMPLKNNTFADLCFKIPQIYISAYNPEVSISGFESRVKIVHADTPVDLENQLDYDQFIMNN